MIESASSTLSVRDVSVAFPRRKGGGVSRVVDGLDLEIARGQVTVLLGESGSGKTVFSRTIAGMAPRRAIVTGQALFDDRDMTALGRRELRRIQGRLIGSVAQDPTSSLDPMRRVGGQVVETIVQHGMASDRSTAKERMLQLLDLVRINEPERVARCYPHQLSGGMRQRVAIAIALSCEPRLLVADEPSSALDASVGVRVVELMDDLRSRLGTSILFITHDIGIAARIASQPHDQVAVMLRGRLVERGSAQAVLRDPRHPYTCALIAAEPSADVPRGQLAVVPQSVREERRWSDLAEVAAGHFVARAEGSEAVA